MRPLRREHFLDRGIAGEPIDLRFGNRPPAISAGAVRDRRCRPACSAASSARPSIGAYLLRRAGRQRIDRPEHLVDYVEMSEGSTSCSCPFRPLSATRPERRQKQAWWPACRTPKISASSLCRMRCPAAASDRDASKSAHRPGRSGWGAGRAGSWSTVQLGNTEFRIPNTDGRGVKARLFAGTTCRVSSPRQKLQHDRAKFAAGPARTASGRRPVSSPSGAGNMRRQRAQHTGSAPLVLAPPMNSVGVRIDSASALV